MNDKIKTIIKVLGVLLALYLFLVGIKGLSSGIKLLGGGFAKEVMSTTSNPFVALFIGVLATTLFQSSSTTTSLIVAMVGGGTLTLSGAVPMIMGANIGTTVTNTIVSIGHIQRGNEFKRAFQAATVHDFFNVLTVLVLFPLEYFFGILEKSASWLGVMLFGTLSTEEVFKSPIKAAIKWGSKQVQLLSPDNNIIFIVISVFITFLMLYAIVKLLRSLVLEKVEAFFDTYIFKTAIRAMIFGVFLTISVQSSSITTSTVIPLAGAGVLTLRQIYPFTLGANIGTTVTALLASMTLNVTAMVASFAHLFFNIFGILLVYANPLLRDIPPKMSEKFSDLSQKSKLFPIMYLLVVFFLVPFLIILSGR